MRSTTGLCAAIIAMTACATWSCAAEDSERVLNYSRDDLKRVARETKHTFAPLIAEAMRDKKTMPSIWRLVARQYIDTRQWQAAWDIQRALLEGAASNVIALDDSETQKLIVDVLQLPPEFGKWEDVDTPLSTILSGQAENPRSCKLFSTTHGALRAAGEGQKAFNIASQLLRKHPNSPLGIEAAKVIQGNGRFLENLLKEVEGTKAATELQFRIAESAREQGKTLEAISAYEKALAQNVNKEDRSRALRGVFELYGTSSNLEKAREWGDRLLEEISGPDALLLAERLAAMEIELNRHETFCRFCLDFAKGHRSSAVAEFLVQQAERAEEQQWLHEAATLYTFAFCLIADANDLRIDELPDSEAEAERRIRFWKNALGIGEKGIVSDPRSKSLAENEPGTREAAYYHYAAAEDALSRGDFDGALPHVRIVAQLCPKSSAATRLLGRVEAQLKTITNQGLSLDEVASIEDLARRAERRRASGDAVGAASDFMLIAETHLESDHAPRALYEAAMIHRDILNDSDTAVDLLERLYIVYPDSEMGATALRLLSRMDTAQ